MPTTSSIKSLCHLILKMYLLSIRHPRVQREYPGVRSWAQMSTNDEGRPEPRYAIAQERDPLSQIPFALRPLKGRLRRPPIL